MFGTYRTILALAVVAHHLLSIPTIGQYAVHGFFILSGYLMTLIMHKSYGYGIQGFCSFAANRFLRLFPSYWIIALISIGIILVIGQQNAVSYHSGIFIPEGISSWMQNASLVYLDLFPMRVFPRLSPPTWALTLELLFYVLIGFGLSKSKSLTTGWFFGSVLFTIWTHFQSNGQDYRYLFIGSASLPFSIGALLYHHKDFITTNISKFSNTRFLIVLLVLFAANSMVAGGFKILKFPIFLQSVGLYTNLILNTTIIAVLIGIPKLPFSVRMDKFIGDFSYPLYLFHWQAGMLVSYLIFQQSQRGPSIRGLIVFLGALILCALVAYLILCLVDRPIENFRKRIRQRAGRARGRSLYHHSPPLYINKDIQTGENRE